MQEQTTLKWTDENVIDLIRKIRNDLVKDFLDERFLFQYLSAEYGIKDIPAVRVQLIKLALKDMLISPVNINHYRDLIQQIKETDTASLSDGNERIFYAEVERVLKPFLY